MRQTYRDAEIVVDGQVVAVGNITLTHEPTIVSLGDEAWAVSSHATGEYKVTLALPRAERRVLLFGRERTAAEARAAKAKRKAQRRARRQSR